MSTADLPYSLSIILPCFNPTTGWAENVRLSYTKLNSILPGIELIIVNDGSSKLDETAISRLISSNSSFKLISYSANRGKGYALRQGVMQATGDLIIYTDVDFPYTHDSFMKIYSLLVNRQADVAIGVRGEEYYSHLPKARVRISKLLRWFIRKFLRIPTDDTQCGLKGFNNRGKEAFLQTTIDRYLFDLEFVFLAARNNLSIKTEVVELKPEIQLTKMNWKILLQEFGNFLKIFVKSLFNK